MIKQLIQSCRPSTGVFATIAAIISWRYEPAPWPVMWWSTISFACLTWSIMVFNDWVDRDHDVKKGKQFAHDNPRALWRFWLTLNAFTSLALLFTLWYSPMVGAFCGTVWITGLLYSYAPHWYVAQNLIVAFCSCSPTLLGCVYSADYTRAPISLALTTFFVIFNREIYKDLEDVTFDQGYKRTLPTVIGITNTVKRVPWIVFGWSAGLILHPAIEVKALALFGLLPFTKNNLDWLIRCLLIAVLATQ